MALSTLSEEEKIEYINKNFYSIYSADFMYSLKITEIAVELSKELKLPSHEALAQKNYGIILYLTGDYEEAQPAYLRSYDLYDSLNDKSGLAQLSNEMANYYQKQGGYQKALDLWAQSEALANEVGDMRALGSSLGMQATFHWIRGNYAESDPLYLRCHQIWIREKDSVGMGYSFLDLADIERRRGNLDKALLHFNQSTSIREAIGDFQGVLENYHAIGNFHFLTNSFGDAIAYYKRAAEESAAFGYPDQARKSLDSLSSIYFKQKDFKNSYLFKVEAENLEDSLFNLERSKIITNLQTKYETEKKEQQIALQQSQLGQQTAEIQRNRLLQVGLGVVIVSLIIIGILIKNRLKWKTKQLLEEEKRKTREAEMNAVISSQEKERSRFARDLHDGFGQLISTLNLNLKNLKNPKNAKEQESVFDSSVNLLEEMYEELKNICFDLMPQTLIKHGLDAAIKEFANRVNLTGQKHIEANVFGLDDRLTELQEISLYRISQEWVNNVLKYSEADQITIQITKDDSEITLLIEDNGIGFDKSVLQEGKGNGWKNMTSRSNLLHGQLELDTTPNLKGTSLILNAPILVSEAKLELRKA